MEEIGYPENEHSGHLWKFWFTWLAKHNTRTLGQRQGENPVYQGSIHLSKPWDQPFSSWNSLPPSLRTFQLLQHMRLGSYRRQPPSVHSLICPHSTIHSVHWMRPGSRGKVCDMQLTHMLPGRCHPQMLLTTCLSSVYSAWAASGCTRHQPCFQSVLCTFKRRQVPTRMDTF